MFITFKKWSALYVLVLVVLFAGFAAILWRGSAINASKNLTLEEKQAPVLVIDPGHGGIDGGAVAEDGTVESDINLSVSLQMEALAHFLGREVVLTRQDNTSLHDENAGSVRQKKISDLKNRAALANGISNAVLVSIHQNSLPEAKTVHGAQAFYNPNGESLAQAVQAALNTAINDRPKEPKAAGTGIYLLQTAQVPAVLVECGFLSNPEETALLNTPEHQTKLAVTILASVLENLA